MELEVQKFLRAFPNDGLQRLSEPPYSFSIKEEDNMVLLKYDQIKTDFSHPISKECRGIILEKDTWDVVACPFFKFFNFSEPYADKVEGNLHIYQKVDGSLAKVFYYNGEWRLATNGCINARTTELSGGVNFFDLFEYTLLFSYQLSWERFTYHLRKDTCYMFELCTEKNQVVIPYQGYHIFYLGERNKYTLVERYEPMSWLGIENVKVYNFHSIDEIIVAANELPDDEEGYVVRDDNWRRVKIKNPTYFMLHRMTNNGRPNLLEKVLNNDADELLVYFPQYTEEVNRLKQLLEDVKTLAENYHNWASYIWNLARKDYAMQVQRDVPKYLQPYIYKVYENHELAWVTFTEDWSVNKWEKFLEDKR